jgi:DNA segregation ATPase FtsK/SpoIIIE-like protein
VDSEYLNNKKEVLLDKFKDFGIEGEVVNIITGPVVTLFEFQPAPGIKLSKITSLTNDLTMALKALTVRIVAPIPGKSVVGIEIPNEKRQIVFFKEIINSSSYENSESLLTIAIGKTIDGTPFASDLAKMPHLLVAGSTGSGKSVCINTILISILYRATFTEVKLILVDPKMLELSVYNNIPHLLLPVVTQPEKAAIALRWAIGEMERRYELLAEAEVRDIKDYNKQTKDEDKKLPYIVIVIDELADLMMIAPKDVETSIARLAQKARAAGIHLILATQRPSVDVITGVIKNNLPSRIAFKVTSRADSRTIIDSMGAESLLGYGDMLFIPPGTSSPVRLQGAFITNDEILKVTNYLKSVSSPKYIEEEILNYESEDNKKNTVSYLTCPYCKGFGYLLTEYCDECKGKGKIRIQKEVFIEIPLGLKEGDILYISKFAINSSCDLYLEINILPHPYFILKENKLIYKCKIPFWEIILKEEIPIYTLEGEEKISTSLFTQGSPIVIKGRGPFLSNGERGDLIVDFTIYIPENIPSEAKKLISKAAEIIQKKNGF